MVQILLNEDEAGPGFYINPEQDCGDDDVYDD
jgi:hypothetical protein